MQSEIVILAIYRQQKVCETERQPDANNQFYSRYENEFERCFKTHEKRTGEICNACVLLVKRWKKLPPGTVRDWRHVVDARAGPGTKVTTGVGAGHASVSKSARKQKKIATINTDDILNGKR